MKHDMLGRDNYLCNVLQMFICTSKVDLEMTHSYNQQLYLFTTELVCINKYSCEYKAWSMICLIEGIIHVNILQMCICILKVGIEMKHPYNQHLVLLKQNQRYLESERTGYLCLQ